MVKHVVMWKMNEKNTEENLEKMKRELQTLKNSISYVEELEVGIDYLQTPASADIVLITSFRDQAQLDSYRTHPAHLKVVEFVNKVTASRLVVDYVVE